MAKLPVKKKATDVEEAVLTPEVVKPTPEKEEFPKTALPQDNLFTVRLDNKKMESRTVEQALALVHGSAGAVKRITIDLE